MIVSLIDLPLGLVLLAHVFDGFRNQLLEYLEIDVSAHAPRMQRTLLELGYNPTGFVPALAFDEWNTYVAGKAPDFFEDYDIADALYAGALMNACLARADRIKMSAIFNLINVMGNYRVTPTAIWKTESADV